MRFISLEGLCPELDKILNTVFKDPELPYLVLNISFANERFWVSFEYCVSLFDNSHPFKKLFDAKVKFFSVLATISEEDFFTSLKNCKTRYNLYLSLMSFDPNKHDGLSANYLEGDKANLIFGFTPKK